MNKRPPVFAIALLALATLAYEILLMRLFSITQWHHFAYMIISLALLGYGASGSFVTLLQKPMSRHFPIVFTGFIGLFSTTAIAAFLLAQQLPFNAEELLWDPKQPLWLLALYLLLAIPFFFSASAIALALLHYRDDVGRLYAFDLFGAGLGGLTLIALLYLMMPLSVLAVIGLLGGLAAMVAATEMKSGKAWQAAIITAIATTALAWSSIGSSLRISPYKGLSQTLQVSGAQVVEQRSSPLGLLTVVENRVIPFRHAPGLSLMASSEPPPQVAVFTDGDAMTVITRDSGNAEAFRYLDEVPSALPYHFRPLKKVLVLGAGGGADVLQARYHGADTITAVELNPQLVELLRNRYGEFSGHLYDQPGVELRIADARGFVSATTARFDLIQLPPLDAFGASGAGLHALNENYLYTVEALQTYLGRLEEQGYLSISRWIRLPPRDTLKLLVTAVTALRQQGIADPGRHLVLIRNWQLATLVLKKSPFATEEIEALKRFARTRAFDLAWYPGISADEPNRYNRLAQPWFYQAATALMTGNGQSLLDDYKFKLAPPTDDRPYFFHFFKWRTLPEILSLRGRGGVALLEQGYLVLMATLLQAVLASALLILLPLHFFRSDERDEKAASRFRIVVYFGAIGLAFLFIEMTFIQKFILLLHHPLYAVVTVMTSFLLFAGAGSLYSQRLIRSGGLRRHMRIAAIAIVLFSAPVWLIGAFSEFLLSQPLPVKALATIVTIAPLAFFMGMPFPLALAAIGKQAPGLIPWAWGINGCASVVSTIVATLLAMHFGFSVVLLLALLLYLVAATAFPR